LPRKHRGRDFTLLTGARHRATASLKLKHINVQQRRRTADSTTWFFPVGDNITRIVADWVAYFQQQKLWGLGDPLFPATKVAVGATGNFEVAGLDRKHWSSAAPIRRIFNDAFARAGLP
jgi:hypothetical protein